jgi:hypothetical protein
MSLLGTTACQERDFVLRRATGCGFPYKASMPIIPRAPAIPAPTTPVGTEAPPDERALDGLLEPEGRRVADEMPDRVAFPPVGEPLTVDALEVVALPAGVVVAGAAAGYREGRMLLTSAGRPVYHGGGFPAAMDDAISAPKDEGFWKAESWMDCGIAVARTEKTDLPTLWGVN